MSGREMEGIKENENFDLIKYIEKAILDQETLPHPNQAKIKCLKAHLKEAKAEANDQRREAREAEEQKKLRHVLKKISDLENERNSNLVHRINL